METISKYIQTLYTRLTRKKQRAILNGSQNGEETNNSDSGNEINVPLGGSPFRVIGNNKKGYTIAIGQYQLLEREPTKHLLAAVMEREKWNIITNMILLMPKVIQDMQGAEEAK